MPTARRVEPDVALLDIELPGVGGIEVVGPLRASVPGCRVLLLTSVARPGTLRLALSVRVDGLILKDVGTVRN